MKYFHFIITILFLSCSQKMVFTEIKSPDGTIQEQGHFCNTKKTGTWYLFNKEGKVISEISYKKGKKHGTMIELYDDGSIYSICNYKRDKPCSDAILFYADGKRNTHRNFNGSYYFRDRLWDSEGNLKDEVYLNKTGESIPAPARL